MAVNPGQDNQAYMHGKGPDAPPPGYAPQGQYPMGSYPPPQQPGQHPGAYVPAQPSPYVAQPGQTTVVVQQSQARPENYMILSCIVYWCCNWLFGGIGFALSLASSSAADDNDMGKARQLGRASMWVNIAGIILTILIIVIFLIIYFVVLADALDDINDDRYSDTYYG